MSQDTLLMALWRQSRAFPVAIGSLLVINILLSLSIFLVQAPQSAEIEREYIELQARTRQGKAMESETPQARYTQMKSDLQKFRSIIPVRGELSGLIAELYEVANASGLEVKQVSYTPSEIPAQELISYALSFSLNGNYGEIKKFIFSLEQSERLIVIDKISLSAAPSSDKSRQVTLRIGLTTYFQNDEPL